ncbi:TIGR03364 family FAD-dependent oxidoreductase [Ideonella sp. DXS29W]|uniref:TIGR03364 family FAD-dependent oxidoreductase n=1 Tax=Ideonella lacteola TaxID=2984193 RepID=A0ABU9BNC6_9BURK
MSRRVAIIGAGVVGLAHAWAAAERGHQVTVFERDAQAIGASVRNFGLGLVLGQPLGERHDLALRSREIWLGLLPRIGAWHKAEGSLMVARDEVQWRMLQAFQALLGADYATRLMTDGDVARQGAQGLGGLFSRHEISLDAREAIPRLTAWLKEAHGVVVHHGAQVHGIELPLVETSHGRFTADEVVVCAGHDFQTLYPKVFAPLGLRRCALQMLRLADPGIQLKPALLTGLSCLHYPSFTQHDALTAPLHALRQHVQSTQPDVLAHGVHLIVQQVGANAELIIGDSHDHGAAPAPFNRASIDDLLLAEAAVLLQRPLRVLERWQGLYASGPKPFEVHQPAPGVRVVAITSGVGMSIAYALAERHFAE